jgi:hypothetical protein
MDMKNLFIFYISPNFESKELGVDQVGSNAPESQPRGEHVLRQRVQKASRTRSVPFHEQCVSEFAEKQERKREEETHRRMATVPNTNPCACECSGLHRQQRKQNRTHDCETDHRTHHCSHFHCSARFSFLPPYHAHEHNSALFWKTVGSPWPIC